MHASPTFLVRLDGHVVVGLVAGPVDNREVVQRLHLHDEHRALASGVVVLEGTHPAAAVPAQLLARHVEDDPRELPVHDEVRVQQDEALDGLVDGGGLLVLLVERVVQHHKLGYEGVQQNGLWRRVQKFPLKTLFD